MRLIDGDTLKEQFKDKEGDEFTAFHFYEAIDKMPTIEERKTGKWVNDEHDIQHCSCCQYIPAYDTAIDDIYYSPYCPNCGAKMEGTTMEVDE